MYIKFTKMKNQFNLKSFKTPLSIGVACLGLLISFSACNKSNNTAPEQPHANIVVINASEAAGSQDIYINGFKIGASSLSFGQIIGYTPVDAGVNLVEFRAPGTVSVISSSAVTTTINNYYSVFLGDNNASVALQDDKTAPQATKARIRFVNLSGFLTSNGDFGPTGGIKTAANIAPKTATFYYEIDPAITSISTYASGSTTAIINTPVALAAGRVYIFLTTGTTSSTFQGKLLTEL
jgi:hypothetical protein